MLQASSIPVGYSWGGELYVQGCSQESSIAEVNLSTIFGYDIKHHALIDIWTSCSKFPTLFYL